MNEAWIPFILAVQWFFLAYFVLLNGVYLALNVISIIYIRGYTRERELEDIPRFYSAYAPAVSILVPAYNEETTIVDSIRSLFMLIYPEYEIVIINDGSKDSTLEVLRREFGLVPMPAAYVNSLNDPSIRSVYSSYDQYNLRVIDKVNGGKADSLNAGIRVSSNPLVCCVDADSILQPDSLIRVVQTFIEDPKTIASGGTIRIANGCVLEGSMLTQVGLPDSKIAMVQIVEYLRAFLFGRLGWSPMNALLIISGAFSVFRRDALTAVGGYRTDTMGEDMELVVRMHRYYRTNKLPYRISFIPDPICWTEAPEDLKTLRNQRVRWQRGLGESLLMNKELLFHPRGGLVGWVAFPFMLIFELLSPGIELVGYLFMIIGAFFGVISMKALAAFLMMAIGTGLLLSVNALLLEEMSFHMYTRFNDIFRLLLAVVMENFGYRQLTLFWRLQGLFMFVFRRKGSWGAMKRKAMVSLDHERVPTGIR